MIYVDHVTLDEALSFLVERGINHVIRGTLSPITLPLWRKGAEDSAQSPTVNELSVKTL
jgi:hypothetical protein